MTDSFDAIIVGAGFAGLRMLHRMRELGFSAVVLEAGDGIGGVWHWNRYPGARCDVTSPDYSYPFDPELDQEWTWSERYATQPEILRYIDHVADRYDLRRDIRLNTTVTRAEFDEATDTWVVHTDSGGADGASSSSDSPRPRPESRNLRARWLLMATGQLSATRTPDFPGLESFAGEVLWTAKWPKEGRDLTGKRVAVIGTGSSGTQMIPVIAEQVAHLTVFQRTPNFSVPAGNRPLTESEMAEIKATYPQRRAALHNTPSGMSVPVFKDSALEATPEERRARYESQWGEVGFGFVLSYSDLLLDQRANETAADFLREKIREKVRNPELAEKLSPRDYPFGAKRPCVDTNYFETFNLPHVELVDVREEPIVAITPTGVRTAIGSHDADVLILATGFDALTGALNRIDIRGVGGVALRDRWADGPSTYLGIGISGFPNFFVIAGPGSPSLLTNVIVSIEQHAQWIGDLLAHAREHGVTRIDVDPEAEAKWTAHVAEAAARTLYPQADTYYLSSGSSAFMPYVGGVRGYRRVCDDVAAEGYVGFTLSPAGALSPTG
ncbi:MAG TPA: NAD(P)/FAD-dependent oxidoreductase [Sporichthya sp.]|nr:NAD(P)/FAD-dependent oxidoreductase [Sporichthya sp.]